MHDTALRDPVVDQVRADLLQRSQLGIAKYGVTLARTDLSLRDWMQHAYEETLDQALYLKRAIAELSGCPADAAMPIGRTDGKVHTLVEKARSLGLDGEPMASWVIGELMLADPCLRLDIAQQRYQQATGGR